MTSSTQINNIKKKIKNDNSFKIKFLNEAFEKMLNNELNQAKFMLRLYLGATRAWTGIAKLLNCFPSNLHKLLKEDSNPTIKNFFSLMQAIMLHENIKAHTFLSLSINK